MGLRDELLAIDDREIVPVEVPAWGRTLHVRSLSAGEADRFEVEIKGAKPEHVRAMLLVITVCDENGQLIFAPGDVEALAGKRSAATLPLYRAAIDVNRMSPGDVDALEKN